MGNNIEKKFKYGVNLSEMTTFRIGGPAKIFLEAKDADELKEAISWADGSNISHYILGGGSNILASDDGYDGLVIKLNIRNIVVGDRVMICGAGAALSAVVLEAMKNSLGGLEWASGIPGTIGGAVRGNAGAFGSSMSECVDKVDALDSSTRQLMEFDRNACGFGYRDSLFKRSDDLIITEVTVGLHSSTQDKIRKHVEEFNRRRKKIQPPFPSAGSVFKNIKFETLMRSNPRLAQTAEASGVVKGDMVGAGWIIDQLGIKGKKIGGAMVSEEHANFIVNCGNAKAEHVVMLISYIKQQARDEFDIQLVEEIMYLGFD